MKRNKKIIQFILLLIFLLVLIVAAKFFLPFGKIFHLPPTPGEFVNRQVNSRSPNSISLDFEVNPDSAIPPGLFKGIAHSGRFS